MAIKNKLIISLIPSKKNSFRLKNKNSRKIKGLRLFEIAINQSLKSKYIDFTFISSNSYKILKIAYKLGAITIKRKEKFCKANSGANEVIQDFIYNLDKKIKDQNPHIVYLQPTSPFRTHKHIDEAIRKFKKNKYKTLISFCRSDSSFFKNVFLKKKKIFPIFKKYFNSNYQNLPNCLKQNGAIYIFSLKKFLEKKHIPTDNIIPYIMDEKSSLDIDTIKDLKKIKK